MFSAKETVFSLQESSFKSFTNGKSSLIYYAVEEKTKTKPKNPWETPIGKTSCENKQGKEIHGDRLLMHI